MPVSRQDVRDAPAMAGRRSPERKYPLFAKMTGQEIKEAARKGKAILVPVGAIENHGDHLPVDVDNLIVERLCKEAALCRPDLIISAPTIHYGYNEHNMDFPGTLNVYQTHFVDYCFDVGMSFTRNGFRVILFVNGHGSNAHLLDSVARQVTLKGKAKCAALSHWDLTAGEISELRESPYPGGMGHACEWETSIYMYLDAAQVKKERMKPNILGYATKHWWMDMDSAPVHFVARWSSLSPASMVLGDPTLASSEKGRKIFEAAVCHLTEATEELIELELQDPVDHQYRQDDEK